MSTRAIVKLKDLSFSSEKRTIVEDLAEEFQS